MMCKIRMRQCASGSFDCGCHPPIVCSGEIGVYVSELDVVGTVDRSGQTRLLGPDCHTAHGKMPVALVLLFRPVHHSSSFLP